MEILLATFLQVGPEVAKVKNAPGPRRQGWSRPPQFLGGLRSLDNKGNGVLSTFPEGKQHGDKATLPENNLELCLDRKPIYYIKAFI